MVPKVVTYSAGVKGSAGMLSISYESRSATPSGRR